MVEKKLFNYRVKDLGLRARLEKAPEWGAVLEVQERLTKSGHLAFLAGGCVRDGLLGLSPKDFDLATDAPEDLVERLFPRAHRVGKSFGVLVLPFEGFQIELAQFRAEGEYKDGRRPDVWRKATPEEDSKRRDFTINALFFDLESNEVVDFVGGLKDLKDRKLRAVGDPGRRFDEDKLRLFRAVRLAAQLDFSLEASTERALKARAQEVFMVSHERQTDEFLKLLKSKGPHVGLRWMAELKWLKPWSLDLEIYERSGLKDPSWGGDLSTNGFTFWEFLGERDTGLPDEAHFLALLLTPAKFRWSEDSWSEFSSWANDKGKVLKEVHKLSSHQAQFVAEGLKLLPGFFGWKSVDQAFWERASRSSSGPTLHKLLGLEEEALTGKKDKYEELEARYEFRTRGLPEPWVTGDVLISQGEKPSTSWGRVLEEAMDLQLNGSFKSQEEALSWARLRLRTVV